MSPSKQFEEEEIILHLSDIHFGEEFDLPANGINPGNRYNMAVARKRLDYVFDRALRYGRDIYSRVIPVTKLNVFITGDCIHNEMMRGSAKMTAEVDVQSQVQAVSDALATNIVNLAERFTGLKSVHIYDCWGNHGRPGGKPGDEDARNNFDRQVFHEMSLRIKLKTQTVQFRKRGIQIHTQPTQGGVNYAVVNGHWCCLEHGNGIKNQLGIPYYGVSRKRDLRFKQRKGKLKYYFLGHFHREYKENDGTVKTLMCPSLVGLNPHADELGCGTIAGAMFYMVSRKHGITCERPINVMHIQEG